MTYTPPAPDVTLNVIKCDYKTTSKILMEAILNTLEKPVACYVLLPVVIIEESIVQILWCFYEGDDENKTLPEILFG